MKWKTGVFLISALVITATFNKVSAQESHRQVTFPLPGHSGASPVLQKDALMLAIVAAGTTDRTCHPKSWDDIYVANTTISHFPETPGTSPWSENWTVNVCGKDVIVTVNFLPHPDPKTGTSIKVDLFK